MEKKERGKIEQIFEGALWNFRFSILIVVVALLFSSLICFYLGIHSISEAYFEVVSPSVAGELATNTITVYLISALDEFLLGIILIIIALGVYELFISKLDVIGEKDIPYPNWLIFHTLDDLKAVLTKVIIIILMVYFFKNVVLMNFETPLEILYLGLGIVLIAVANYLTHAKTSMKHK